MDESLLHNEHVLLGASIREGADDRLMPDSYPHANADEAFSSGCALIDMTGFGSRLMGGSSVEAFVCSAFAGKRLSVGEIALEAVLLGDGALASIAILARTGDAEYAAWDVLGRGDILFAWLGFVSEIQQEGMRAFEGLSMEDASEALVPLMLYGPKAPGILVDYVGEQELPPVGTITGVSLDDIGCLVAAVPIADETCYLVLVPPRFARILWRSFLSFPIVTPVSPSDLAKHIVSKIGLVDDIEPLGGGRVMVGKTSLVESSLIRNDLSFVGARALDSL